MITVTHLALWLTKEYSYTSTPSLYLHGSLYGELYFEHSGFGGLCVSMLASGTQDRGFAPDRSRRIFSVEVKHLSHVPALVHVKEPSSFVNYEFASKITYSSFLR
jgi:hypothetical protein